MKIYPISIVLTVAVIVLVMQPLMWSSIAFSGAKNAFGFNAPLISGFPGGNAAEMTGGGAYDLPSNFVHSGGGFRCLSDITAPAFFAGCKAGEGVRWDTASIIPSTGFKCTNAATETQKTATTGDRTVVLIADFYRQGDGNDESFTARMFVSDSDLAPDFLGVQNVWIQGIGCGTATASFN
jgi:hypothetical protein